MEPMKRMAMRVVREVLKWVIGLGKSLGEAAELTQVSRTTCHDIVKRAKAAGLGWPLPEGCDDAALKEKLYPRKKRDPKGRLEPDLAAIWETLKAPRSSRAPQLTRQLLWEEYRQKADREGKKHYSYSWFCEALLKHAKLTPKEYEMRFEYSAGKTMMSDFAGKTLFLERKGQRRAVEIFVAMLAYSKKLYVVAVPNQTKRWWIQAHRGALEYWGGVPMELVHDNLKSGVKANRGIAGVELTQEFQEFCDHYGLASLPTRPREPRDKGAIESAVKYVETALLAAMRHIQFFSVEAMNAEIKIRLEALNQRQMKIYRQSREKLFAGERPYLQPLPAQPYEWSEWHRRKVGRNYHVNLEGNYYSVDCSLVGKLVHLRETATIVEIYTDSSSQQRLAIHPVLQGDNQYRTIKEHMPQHHQSVGQLHAAGYGDWLLTEAKRAGQSVYNWAVNCMSSRPFEQQAYNTVRGLLKLGENHGADRLKAACEAAMAVENHTYGYLKDWLKTQAGQKAESDVNGKESIPAHENIRGSAAYRDHGIGTTTEK